MRERNGFYNDRTAAVEMRSNVSSLRQAANPGRGLRGAETVFPRVHEAGDGIVSDLYRLLRASNPKQRGAVHPTGCLLYTSVRVATSDAAEQMIVLGHGALRVSADEFREEVLTVQQEIRQVLRDRNRKEKNPLMGQALKGKGIKI